MVTEVDTEKRYTEPNTRGIALYWTGEYDEVWDEDFEEMNPDPEWPMMCMVGDDRKFPVELSELTEISEYDYCGQCGQLGCSHGGMI